MKRISLDDNNVTQGDMGDTLVAKIYGEAGKYCTKQASRKLELAFGALIALSLACGLFFGALLANRRHPLAWIGVILAAAAFYGVTKFVDPWLGRVLSERRKYQRGADGEELVGDLLGELPDDWHVFHGVQLDGAADLDHIAVGPGGLYYISTKNYRGLFSQGPDGQLLYNNEPTDLPVQALRQGISLRERLRALVNSDEYINVVLAIPLAWVELRGLCKNVHVLHKDNLVKTLESAPERLRQDEVQVYVKALEMLAASALEIRHQARLAGMTKPSTPLRKR